MGLNQIHLPDFLIPGLFKDNLVLTQEDIVPKAIINQPIIAATVAVATPAKPSFLGENKKNISIIVNDTDAVYLKDEWLQFLTNMLNACKLNVGDVAIFNLARTQISYTELLAITNPKHIILFGVDLKEINMSFVIPNYQVQEYNGATILTTASLALMLGNTEVVKTEKTKLWVSLKNMFGI